MRRLGIVLATWALSGPAWACGQSTHVWIGIHALDHLPEGELKDLLSKEEHFAELVNGAMFPDGGYSPIVRDAYGETAHWEPFQTTWMNWIRDTYGTDLEDPEAQARLVFLMGLAAHGMADQVYDGVYLTRSLFYDGEAAYSAGNSVDTATDVAIVSYVGALPIVEDVVPYDDLVHVFNLHGQPVERSKLEAGQASLRIAIQWVGAVGESPEAEDYKAQFPWASEHLLDTAIPGSPACISAPVAAYWQALWDRFHERYDFEARAVVHTFPEPTRANHPTSAADIESQIGAVLGRALTTASLESEGIEVTDQDGVPHEVTYRLYYGNGSNVLNLYPTGDWAEDAVYTVTLNPGLESFDGRVLEQPASFQFTTGAEPLVGPEDVEDDVACEGCATGTGSWGWLGLLGLAGLRRRRV